MKWTTLTLTERNDSEYCLLWRNKVIGSSTSNLVKFSNKTRDDNYREDRKRDKNSKKQKRRRAGKIKRDNREW